MHAGRQAIPPLSAGSNILTRLKVQHVELFNDIVAEISGVLVRETVQDTILDQADEVTLIDVSPDNLLERLSIQNMASNSAIVC